ncbi:HAD family hydrolase [Motiliproteus sp. SC1-56]|uniref:HAD family hydrolase n=1 Tax=Motiliproteus sp. SC1-56 TaxID=2799565 RepID=UPI001A8F7BC6|nr:HAD family hydrolase [Motiliproteus sp. SC1-56]
MIRVVTFDLDDTLWAVAPVIERANRELYTWLDEQAPLFTRRWQPEDFDSLRREVVREHPEWAHSVTAIRLGVLRKGLRASGYSPHDTEHLAEAAFTHFLNARNQVEFFQHALAMLTHLGQRYQLGALSNGNADIEKVGLGEYFDFCFNADQVGRAKPDPLMFEQMLRFTGAEPTEVVHVGDHPEHDILGAQNAGIHSLWVNFERQPWPGAKPPSLEVHCLSDIPAAIEALANQAPTQGSGADG